MNTADVAWAAIGTVGLAAIIAAYCGIRYVVRNDFTASLSLRFGKRNPPRPKVVVPVQVGAEVPYDRAHIETGGRI